jgi:preprotein translocase subunit SecA
VLRARSAKGKIDGRITSANSVEFDPQRTSAQFDRHCRGKRRDLRQLKRTGGDNHIDCLEGSLLGFDEKAIGRSVLPRDENGEFASKVGRNDPCPCGSGKKFKKCCGKAG